MTEAEWLGATDPGPILQSLAARAHNKNIRRFACACCLRVGRLLTEGYVRNCRNALAIYEQHLEGLASDQELEAARTGVFGDTLEAGGAIAHPGEAHYYAISSAAAAVYSILRGEIVNVAAFAASAAAYDVLSRSGSATLARIGDEWRATRPRQPFYRERWDRHELEVRRLPEYERALAAEHRTQCVLLRDILGNPFRPVSVDRSWLTQTVVALARQVYESRDFSPMPILADALQDAGCDNDDTLHHSRQPGEHVRGCWVVDAILDKT